MRLWAVSKTNESYQNIVLRYLDGLPYEKMMSELKSEVRKIYEKNNYYYRVKYFLKEREDSIKMLKELLVKVGSGKDWVKREMDRICGLINHIRKIGMMVCEEVVGMFSYFKYDPERDGS